ncbi:MAG: glycosyltransferase [Caldilineaceae bacterium]|nr:glycosyltransferase [Caldilineaceae bacterium]
MITQNGIPQIDTVPKGIARPFWSVMIPTYNCAAYLQQTLESVLDQDIGPEQMQIEVVDDCSTKDDPEAVVNTIGRGRVSFYRQPRNVGATANFNSCIKRSIGHVVHILHGDDYILPSFYERLRQPFIGDDGIGAAFCRHVYVDDFDKYLYTSRLERDECGVLADWVEQIATSQRIQFPSIVVRRSVYESIGGFSMELVHAADWEMWRRIATYYPVWFEPQPLACYRLHTASDTSRLVTTGRNIADIRKSIAIAQQHLENRMPRRSAREISRQAREHYAYYALRTAENALSRSDWITALAQSKEALKCSASRRVLRNTCTLYVRHLLNFARNRAYQSTK